MVLKLELGNERNGRIVDSPTEWDTWEIFWRYGQHGGHVVLMTCVEALVNIVDSLHFVQLALAMPPTRRAVAWIIVKASDLNNDMFGIGQVGKRRIDAMTR